MPRNLGRKPRTFNPRVPHMSALMAPLKSLPPPPPTMDWLSALPDDLGMMMNDQLGDCTCAAVYHAIQVWTFNASGKLDTEPDQDVLRLYELACGYNPADPSTDQGGIEQDVLGYWKLHGAPLGAVTGHRHQQLVNKLAAFVEIDPRVTDDVKHGIADCGLVYIGFQVPAFLMDGEPPAVWDVNPSADNSIIGGHAIVLPSYDSAGLGLISWGAKYKMTWGFFAQFVDEVYAPADPDWISAKGTTLAGLTLAELEAQMAAIAEA